MFKFNKLLAVFGLATCALLITTSSYASMDEAIEQFNNGELETATKLFNNANANLEETAIANSFLGRKATEKFKLSIAHAGDEETYQRSKYSALYQIGRTSVVSENNIESGMAALREYIQTAPTLNGLPSKNWAEFRLANLLELSGQQTEAKKIYTTLEKNVTDNNLKKAIQAAI